MVRAEEALSAVKTVRLHCAENFEALQYLAALKKAERFAVQRSAVLGEDFYCSQLCVGRLYLRR